jgi:hypothetical protein
MADKEKQFEEMTTDEKLEWLREQIVFSVRAGLSAHKLLNENKETLDELLRRLERIEKNGPDASLNPAPG